VKFRFKRIAMALMCAGMVLTVFYRGQDMQRWFNDQFVGERSSVIDRDRAVDFSGEFWSSRGYTAREIRWQGGEGWVPGRVELEKWETPDRMFYRVRGPASPRTSKANAGDGSLAKASSELLDQKSRLDASGENDPVFCEVFFRTDFGCEVRKFSAASATSFWMLDQRINAVGAVLPFAYRVEEDAGYVTLTFWTTRDEPVGNIVFRYREEGLAGWLSTDGSSSSRLDIGQWTWP